MKTEMLIATISRIRRKANQFIVDELAAKGIRGLVPSHGEILEYLFRDESLTMQEIARRIRRKKNTVTVLVNKLIHQGYLKKKVDPADKRVIWISVTPKARKINKAVNDISQRLVDRAYQGLSGEERKTVMRILGKIENNFD